MHASGNAWIDLETDLERTGHHKTGNGISSV